MARRGFCRALLPSIALAVTSLTGTLTGCGVIGGAPSSAAAAEPLESTVLNVAAVPSVDSAGFFVAMYEGLFNRQGLMIRYTPALVTPAHAWASRTLAGPNAARYLSTIPVTGEPATAASPGPDSGGHPSQSRAAASLG